jgi:hypothetical protein
MPEEGAFEKHAEETYADSQSFPPQASVRVEDDGEAARDGSNGVSQQRIVIASSMDGKTARVYDLVTALCLAFAVMLLSSMYWNRGIQREVTIVEQEVRRARERHATVDKRVQSDKELLAAARREADVPKPAPETRDAHLIGRHADLFWSYSRQDRGQYVNYKVELIRNDTGDRSSTQPEICGNSTEIPRQDWWSDDGWNKERLA